MRLFYVELCCDKLTKGRRRKIVYFRHLHIKFYQFMRKNGSNYSLHDLEICIDVFRIY